MAPPVGGHVGFVVARWGLFNLVEGTINHQILGIHHVRTDLGGPLSCDLGFLAFDALLIVRDLAMASQPKDSNQPGQSTTCKYGPQVARIA